MSTPYVGEIRMFAGNFAPAGWAFCNGALLPISENDTLFVLIGTTYGGDGQETFALPDLQGRFPIHMGTGAGLGSTRIIGERAGTETETLTVQQIPSHTHPVLASTSGATGSPANALMATATSSATGLQVYSTNAVTTNLHPSSVTASGGNQPHENMQPYLCINFIISLFGIFPSQT